MSPLLVLEDSLEQVAGHADVERVAPASHNIREIDLLFHGENVAQAIDDGKRFALRWHFLGKVQRIASR